MSAASSTSARLAALGVEGSPLSPSLVNRRSTAAGLCSQLSVMLRMVGEIASPLFVLRWVAWQISWTGSLRRNARFWTLVHTICADRGMIKTHRTTFSKLIGNSVAFPTGLPFTSCSCNMLP